MASKKERKPTQEIYRPPKAKNLSEKSHERTFYNSNHKKKNYKSTTKDENNRNYIGYTQDDAYYDNYEAYKFQKFNKYADYDTNSGSSRDNLRNKQKKSYYNDYQSSTDIPVRDSFQNKSRDDYYRKKPNVNNRNYQTNDYKSNKSVRVNYHSEDTNKNVDNHTETVRDTHSKDYEDTRLYNPYKTESDTIQKSVINTMAKDELDTKDKHIHGGLIHLPDNLALNQINREQQFHPNTTSVMEYQSNKPTVMVRPTFTHLSTTNSMQYPQLSLFQAIQTPSGFIPIHNPTPFVQSNIGYVAQRDIQPEHSFNTNQIMNPLRYVSTQIIPNQEELIINHSKNPMVTSSLNKIRILEAQLDSIISSCDLINELWWSSVNTLRSELMQLYRLVILHDLDFCNQANIEQNLWKSVFYSVMELIRKYFINPDLPFPSSSSVKLSAEETKQFIVMKGQGIIKEGDSFFMVLCSELCKTTSSANSGTSSHVDLELIFSSRRPPPETGSRTRKLIYLSCQKLLLFLGDLARYLEIINGSADYSKARLWYLKAQLLVPKNGRPYNQLAVISIYSNRLLDALYYYTRTLAAINPFYTASQCLSFLFEDARRKSEELARRKQLDIAKRKKKRQNQQQGQQTNMGSSNMIMCGGGNNSSIMSGTDSSSGGSRGTKGWIEVWIHPDDGTKEKKVTDDDDTDVLASFDGCNQTTHGNVTGMVVADEYLNMPLVDLSKLFILSFINSHGKLFSRINMENFPEVSSAMLQELYAMLSHQPCPLTCVRICHMLIINMYIMDRVAGSPTTSANSMAVTQPHTTLRSLHQDHASRMTLDFFAVMCHRAIQLINEWRPDLSQNSISMSSLPPDLSNLLPGLCLWSDWMVTHPEYWNPPPTHRDPLLPPNIDDFALIAQLCTLVNRILRISNDHPPKTTIITDIKQSEKHVGDPNTFILLEDNLICGFLPMLDQVPKIYLNLDPDHWTREQLEDHLHLEKLGLFGDFLCGINPPLLDYNIEQDLYVSVVVKESSERRQDDQKSNSVVANDDETELEEDLDLKLKLEIDEIRSVHCLGILAASQQAGMKNPESTHITSTESWAEITEAEEREHQAKIARLKIHRANKNNQEEKNRRFELWMKSHLDQELASRFVEMEIRPLFLVLDTNCYIDYLYDIETRLTAYSKFIIVVPLIVVNELENLKRSDNLRDDVDLQNRAAAALRFIEAQFDRGNPKFKAITAQGTFMETIAYRSEIILRQENQNNDDIILNCCQYLCKDKPSEFMPREKDKPITLYREVVLLTGDRQFRIRALARNIPVKPYIQFMQWADIPYYKNQKT